MREYPRRSVESGLRLIHFAPQAKEIPKILRLTPSSKTSPSRVMSSARYAEASASRNLPDCLRAATILCNVVQRYMRFPSCSMTVIELLYSGAARRGWPSIVYALARSARMKALSRRRLRLEADAPVGKAVQVAQSAGG